MQYGKLLNKQIAAGFNDQFPGRPTIIFLHDSLGCIELWRDFPVKLGAAANCNILVYDRHGYGKSEPFLTTHRENDYMEHEADILCEIILEKGISNPVLFGHSDGGTIALLAAAKYPDLITAVITEGAHIFVEDETLSGIREALEDYDQTDLKSKLEKYHGDKTEAMFMAWAKHGLQRCSATGISNHSSLRLSALCS